MKHQALSILILLSISHQSWADTSTPKQCYPDAISAYQVLVKQERQAQAGVVNINTASAASLVSLSGIGHASAAAIIEYRARHGRFGSVDELAKVKGIGKATIDKNRHRLSVMD